MNPLGVVFLCKECHAGCHKMTTAIKSGNDYARQLGKLMREEFCELGLICSLTTTKRIEG
ncbi:hypothetical protein EAH75_01245 [Rhodanobacter glycinis]|nr:hypothetical protein EAH75_01245 [Rhodanobacter glycinis]